MSISFRNFFVSFFLFTSFVVFSASPLEEIYTRCHGIEISCADITQVTSSAINKIENETYTYNAYVDGSNVTTTVRLKEIGGFGHTIGELQRIYDNAVEISNRSGLIRQSATQLSSGGGGGGSYDDTDLLSELDELETQLENISSNVDLIYQELYSYFEEFFTPVYQGFDGVTNSIQSISTDFWYLYSTNNLSHTKPPSLNLFGSSAYGALRDTTGNIIYRNLGYPAWGAALHSATKYSFIRWLDSLYNTIYLNFASLQNYHYTNTLDTISFHRDYQKDFKSYSDFTTNKITEINSIFYNNSPLEDLQNDVTPSNIYNFVTNYYIKVSTDPSGSASENKTNWFNRIELLLTALVFRPEETVASNKFDNATASESQTFKDTLQSVLDGDISEIQGNSQTVLQDFEKTKTSLLNFFSHLDDKLSSLASIPSHIEFFEITTSSGDRKKVEIATQGAFASYADTLRAVSTLCWVSFFVYVIFVLSRWLFLKFSTILKFCYSVFKTLIGIG